MSTLLTFALELLESQSASLLALNTLVVFYRHRQLPNGKVDQAILFEPIST